MKTELENVLPADIEKRSFEIIGEELKMRHIVLDKMQERLNKRMQQDDEKERMRR